MQRMAPNMPPRPNQNASGSAHSPALGMAQRIQREQGSERARQYLAAMEPYLAPAERAYIAEQIGVSLPQSPPPQSFTPPPAQPPAPQPAAPQQPFNGQGNPLAALGNMGGNMGANPMQLLQMFAGMNGGKPGGAPGNMGNLMQMAQMMQSLGPLLGGKK